MCGLVGVAGDIGGNWKDLFSELLLYDVVRGPHSTGAGFVRRNSEEFSLVKRPGHPFNLFDTDEFDDEMSSKKQTKVILGHNRYATVGEKTEANAHPFAFKRIMGMHNGTLDKYCLKELNDADQYGTDSEAIFATIDAIGPAETLKKITGAWALVWFDREKHTLNFLRNDRRPLHYCYSKDRCTIIWASEVDMLKYTMQRKHKDTDEYFTVTKDVHYSWEVPDSANKKFDAPTQVKMEGRTWSYSPTVYTGPFKGAASKTSSGSKTTVTYPHSNPSPEFISRRDTQRFRPPYKDQYNHVLNRKAFDSITSDGCAFCNNNDIKWGQFIHIMGAFRGPNTPFMCESCFNDGESYEYTKYAR